MVYYFLILVLYTLFSFFFEFFINVETIDVQSVMTYVHYLGDNSTFSMSRHNI